MFTDIEPSSDPRLAAVFSAAKAPAELPLTGEAAALAAYRKFDGRSRLSVRLSARPAQMVAAALFGGFLVAGGVATAATGTLPLPAVHHHVSQPQTVSTDDATSDSPSGDDAASSATDMTDTGGPGTDGHPSVLGSVQKGIDACTQASTGTCQAGQHGKALAAHGDHATHSLPSAATTHRSGHAGAAPTGAAAHSAHALLRAANGSLHRRG